MYKLKKKISPEPQGQFQPNLAQIIFGWKGILDYSNEGYLFFPREDDYEIWKYIDIDWANFNQTWQKASLGKEDLSVCKWKSYTFLHWEILTKLRRYIQEI